MTGKTWYHGMYSFMQAAESLIAGLSLSLHHTLSTSITLELHHAGDRASPIVSMVNAV